MTLDDLEKLRYAAWFQHANKRGGAKNDAERAGIRAVVEALRDEICKRYGFQKIWDDFDEILGDAGEKAAGAVAQEVEPRLREVTGASPVRPAADPSAAVCEWTRADKSKLLNVQWWSIGCAPGRKVEWQYQGECPSCRKPIVFKEPKP